MREKYLLPHGRFLCRLSHTTEQHLLLGIDVWHSQRQVVHPFSGRTTTKLFSWYKLIGAFVSDSDFQQRIDVYTAHSHASAPLLGGMNRY